MARRRVALVVGASRGIGRQIAIDLAKAGYAVIVSAKSTSKITPTTPFPPDPNSAASTITTVAREIHLLGGIATAIACDVRSPSSIASLISQTIAAHHHIDVLIYNSGAIWWSSVEKTDLKRFKLMQQVNPEGLYAMIQACMPVWAKQDWQARIVVVSPPIYSRFFRGKTAYAMGKVGMSVLTKGLAMDWVREGKTGMAISSLWPAVAIESAATAQMTRLDLENRRDLRKATVFSDAVLGILDAEVDMVNGELLLDEDFLRSLGVTEFGGYAVVEGARPRRIMPVDLPDLRVREQDDEGKRTDSSVLREGKAKL